MADSVPTSPAPKPLPKAVVRPRRAMSWAWIIPLLALAFAAYLGWNAWTMRGYRINVTFTDAWGLKQGDEVRYRGMVVGEVESIDLTHDLEGVRIVASLKTHSREIARQGTQFWVVRPLVGPGGVAGLDTIIGSRWLAVLPTRNEAAPARTDFIGLDVAPIIESIAPGDLEVILQSPMRGSLQAGGPVTHRGVRVGTILSVGLASDGSAAEARVHIEQAYAPLVRAGSKFWDSGGAKIDAGITGITMEVDSLASLVLGGVAFATPPAPDGGEPVRTGHRFDLSPELDEDWLEWDAAVAIGSSLLPPGAPLPVPERARQTWREGVIFRSGESRVGWVIQTAGGILGPADLLTISEDAREGTSHLEIAGQAIDNLGSAKWTGNRLALLDAQVSRNVWPTASMRVATAPEDCIVVADAAAAPIPLAAPRLEQREGSWKVDEALSFPENWHGACVLSRADGALVGLLLVEDGVGRVALISAELAGD